ncbi:3-dehydroquinate dehydratase [Pikeienuella piscinae]|uniref:3-dehydroquinate dehydratase n=1 Tax=Pikeienuella piscinae TaxID=2748098 RepID=A0A7L5BVB3_9RHOB|nr:3-dehydroquinate dehydratase [Pikeienuella piscinae]
MTKRITIRNGPNLNPPGEWEPEIYGATTLADIESACRSLAQDLGVTLVFRQTNHDGVMVDWIQEARGAADALSINPAGLSFQSVPVLDAIRMMQAPVIELHISNIHARDAAHRDSIISVAATAVICGLGAAGYPVAMLAAARLAGLDARALPGGLSALSWRHLPSRAAHASRGVAIGAPSR